MHSGGLGLVVMHLTDRSSLDPCWIPIPALQPDVQEGNRRQIPVNASNPDRSFHGVQPLPGTPGEHPRPMYSPANTTVLHFET